MYPKGYDNRVHFEYENGTKHYFESYARLINGYAKHFRILDGPYSRRKFSAKDILNRLEHTLVSSFSYTDRASSYHGSVHVIHDRRTECPYCDYAWRNTGVMPKSPGHRRKLVDAYGVVFDRDDILKDIAYRGELMALRRQPTPCVYEPFHYGERLVRYQYGRHKKQTFCFRRDPVPNIRGHYGFSVRKHVGAWARRSHSEAQDFKEINEEYGSHLRRRGNRQLLKGGWDIQDRGRGNYRNQGWKGHKHRKQQYR